MQDLLKRMTLEEKVDQLSSWRRSAMSTDNAEAQQIVEKIQKLSEPGSQVGPRDTAVLRNEAQKFLVERTRLGIPALFQGEALHGFMSNGSTSFPQVLGLASTWDPELVERVFSAAADEMAAAGVRQAFTPVLDLARDPRWGRTEETYGEDPFLVSRMGVAAIRGLQGTSFVIDRHHVLATAKHFAAHGQPEGGRNTAPANYSERILRESFFMPFQAAVEEAHVASVMASYNEIDGIPSHINHWLLDRVLRQEWRFQGYVTSDGGGLQMLVNTHHVAADYAEAARKALAAGVDFDLSDGSVYQTLIEQARRGIIPEKQIDDAVERVLAAKFRLGLFENPYADPDYAAQVTNSREHKELALKAAEEAIVLLKNEGNLLPLDGKKIKSVAVIGPNAADVHLGGYSRDPGPGNQVSILEGIRQRVGAGIKLLYAEGCKLTSAKPGWAGWYVDNVALIDPPTQAQSIQEAAVLARQADVAILVVGENESTNREAWSERHLGDRDSLDLLGAQDKLVQAVIDTGIPTVVFLINGRPLSINYAAQHARAIIEGWYLGEQGGIAAARVLFGDINPGGKLPVTFPRSVGQIPAYYDHKPSRDRSYAFTNSQPLFPFGYGLSYTTFGFDNLRVEPALMDAGGTTTVRVEVTNTGNREGDEIPQLYMHQRVASVTQPVKQLRGFRRVSLRPGEKTTVEFLITPETLSILDINMRGRVEPGTFDIMVGPDSEHTATVPLQIFARE
ncbi:MAG: beta-glucosidase [Acidobacteria bacterium]|nr:MAG: beta-glucosidase [Acidobacteriota bacterium]